MKGLLDTNIIIDLLAGYSPAIQEVAGYSDVFISRVTWMEVLIGSPDAATTALWESFLNQFFVVELDEPVCREAIALRQAHRIKLPDALIWASARLNLIPLVTRNTKDFPAGTPGVRVPYTR
jgi:predicted nucleic acid-binding protein